ncbi:MAG TPA: HEAT repeat domain-containing protein [Candidatus Binataceae bacterium]|nr:HEAT repeat domain-containing protein [Candidatus Binataceae bacterium]
MIVLIVAGNALMKRRARDRWTVAITDPSMVAIRNLVADGKVSQAADKLNTTYSFNQASGLTALRQFSIIVLRRGLKEHDIFEQCYAASALAEGGQNEALQMLANTFQTNPDLSVKMAVADGLGEDGNRKAVAILARLFKHGDLLDRRFIVNALASATDPSAVAVLSEAVRQSDPTLRAAALKGLGQLGNQDAKPLLKLALAKGQIFDRVEAAESLLLLGDNSGLQMLRNTLNDHSEGNARAMAAVALGYAHDPASLAMLRQALTDQNIDVRIGAAAALTHYNDPGGVAYLRGAIHDQDQVTRRHAAQLFDEMQFDVARPVLVEALSSPDADVQLAAVKALGVAGGEPEVVLLGQLLRESKDPITRADIAWSLGRIGSPNGIALLLAMVQETDPAVRYTAADGLDHTAMHLLGGKRLGSR